MLEKAIASFAYAILVSGVVVRKNRRIHPKLMAMGIGIDLSLVIYLQVQRSVIQQAMTESYSLLQMGHIGVSTIAVLLYFPVVYLGIQRLRGTGGPNGRLWHIRWAVTAFAFRSAGFLLMFTM